jgi:hypothetical protein
VRVLDALSLAKRNLATNSAGQAAVRPGLRKLATPTAKFYGGFTVHDAQVGAHWHVLCAGAATAPYGLSVELRDEDFTLITSTDLQANAIPRAFGGATVLRHQMIGGPDIPTQWSLIGGKPRVAVKEPDAVLSSLEVPDGIVISWSSRVVVAVGSNIYVSVPIGITGGNPRTFLAANQIGQRGSVFGLHIGAGGMLVICTDQGVFGLDSGAAAVGVINPGSADFRLLSHHRTVRYQTTCAINGRVYGLTKNGYRLIDVEGAPEVDLDDPMMTRALEKRISLPDYRECRMYAGEGGPIISADSVNALWVTEEDGGISSWWTAGSDIDLRCFGVLRDVDGSDLLVLASGIYAMTGNFDGVQGLTSGYATQPTGFFHGTLPSAPHENETVRAIHLSCAQGTPKAAVRGDSQTGTAYIDSIYGATIGTSVWGGSWRWITAPTVAHRLDFDVNSNDVAIEAGVTGCDNRIQPVLSVEDSKQGKNRPQDRG